MSCKIWKMSSVFSTQFRDFRKAAICSIKEFLPSNCSSEVEESWGLLFDVMGSIMLKGINSESWSKRAHALQWSRHSEATLGILQRNLTCRALNNATAARFQSWGGESHIHSHLKVTGLSSEILKRTPKRYQNSVLWAWSKQFFTPKRYKL